MSDSPPKRMRAVQSFVRREGKITPGQARALEVHWAGFGLSVEEGQVDFVSVFGRKAPVICEIGFGMGHSLLAQAEANPKLNYLGIEVYRPGVGALLNNMQKAGVQNIRVFHHDAVEVLKQCIPNQSLHALQLFFPDPWHKKRHHKRRIMQPDFVQLIAEKIQPGGVFHLATDWEHYAEHMLEVMTAAPGWENQAGTGQFSPRPDSRPLTKFEQRGQRLGHGVWDLLFERVNHEPS